MTEQPDEFDNPESEAAAALDDDPDGDFLVGEYLDENAADETDEGGA